MLTKMVALTMKVTLSENLTHQFQNLIIHYRIFEGFRQRSRSMRIQKFVCSQS